MDNEYDGWIIISDNRVYSLEDAKKQGILKSVIISEEEQITIIGLGEYAFYLASRIY